MADDPTLGELARRLDDRVGDIRDDIRQLGVRLDSKVSLERYQLEQQARDERERQLAERVKSIEDARKLEHQQRDQEQREREQQRRQDRRWVIAAIVVPLLVVLLEVWLNSKGQK